MIVAAGRFELKPLPEVREPVAVFLFSHFRDPARGGQRSGDLSEFLRAVALNTGQPVIDETEGPEPKPFDWVPQPSAYLAGQKPGPGRQESLRKLLDNVSVQTGLKFKQGRRKVPVWVVVEGPALG